MVYICRAFFGATGEALYTIQALLISLYGGKYYDMLIGVGVCIPITFDSLCNLFTPLIYDSTKSMELVWGIGVFFTVFAFICTLIVSYLVTKE